jgi:hypothetical protein
VDRVERPAEKTDIHEPLVSSFEGSIGKLNISDGHYVCGSAAQGSGHCPMVHRQGCLFGPDLPAAKTGVPGIRNELL